MQFITEVYWDKGEMCINEDSISLQHISVKGKPLILAIVCDGIGGLECGEQASGFIAEKMTEWFYGQAVPMIIAGKSRDKIIKAGLRMMHSCNDEMLAYAGEKALKFGTTVTMLLVYKNKYMLWHSGDTRAYRITNNAGRNKTSLLTSDDAEEGNYLTKCIGSFRWKQPETKKGYFIGKQTFLLCSDGFRHIVTEEKIKEALKPDRLKSKQKIYSILKEIAVYSKRYGEKDNISAVIIACG